MKKIVLLLVSLFAINLLQAQQKIDDLTLVVSSDGATKEEATHLALRSAIEQAYGTFVSANTTIINDKIVKDEIATVASGNIKEYEEINVTQLQNGRYYVTLTATVSIGNLVSYAKSKGSSCELAGAKFAQNVKLCKANKKAAEKALDNLINQLYEMGPYLFDYVVSVGNPVVSNPDTPEGSPISGKIPAYVYMRPTETFGNFMILLIQTMNSLTYGKEMYEYYLNMGIKSNHIVVIDRYTGIWNETDGFLVGGFTLIDLDKLMIALDDIFTKAFSNFVIEYNIGKFNCKEYDKKNKHELSIGQDVYCLMVDTAGNWWPKNGDGGFYYRGEWYSTSSKKLNRKYAYWKDKSYDDYIMGQRIESGQWDEKSCSYKDFLTANARHGHYGYKYSFYLLGGTFTSSSDIIYELYGEYEGSKPTVFSSSVYFAKKYDIQFYYDCMFNRNFYLNIADFNKVTEFTIKPLSQKFERDYIKRINNYKLNAKK